MIKDARGAKISLVVADVDGTLVTAEKVLTARAVKSVESLRASGIGFAITSGRQPRGMENVDRALGSTNANRRILRRLRAHQRIGCLGL